MNWTACQPKFEFVFCDVKSTVLLLLILALIFTNDTDMLVVGVREPFKNILADFVC